MKITDVSGTMRGVEPRENAKTGRPAVQDGRSDYGDLLELSPIAKASAQTVQNVDGGAPEPTALDPARLAEIQSRLSSGFYSQPATTSQIADKLLAFYAR
jgi:hypothetical protein